MEESPRHRHPNSPLVEVVFEIRFPGEAAIEGRRYEIQDKLRQDYPNLLVPNLRHGEPAAMVPYRFEREDQTAGVMVALNMFAYYCRNYLGYVHFRDECLKLLSIFIQTFNIQTLTRLGLRHINIIPFVRESGLIPVQHFFVIAEKLGEIFPEGFQNFTLAFVSPVNGGLITTRIEPLLKEDGGQEAFLLDFDYARTLDLDILQVAAHLEDAHTQSRAIFRKLITGSHLDFIKGLAGEQCLS